jgi:carboxymethylenebutenolidase
MTVTSSTTIIFDMRGTLLALLVCTAIQAQDWAKARLEKSPRHHEQVMIKQDGREIATFGVYPDTKDKRPVVVLIHDSEG